MICVKNSFVGFGSSIKTISLLVVTFKIVYHPTEGVPYHSGPEAIFTARISRSTEQPQQGWKVSQLGCW